MSVDFVSDALPCRFPGHKAPWLNLSNVNARALLAVLGLDANDEDGLIGECTIAEARQGVLRARNAPLWRAAFSRPAEDYRIKNGPRVIASEFSADDLLERVERFAQLVEEAAAGGATVVMWS